MTGNSKNHRPFVEPDPDIVEPTDSCYFLDEPDEADLAPPPELNFGWLDEILTQEKLHDALPFTDNEVDAWGEGVELSRGTMIDLLEIDEKGDPVKTHYVEIETLSNNDTQPLYPTRSTSNNDTQPFWGIKPKK